LLGPLMLDVKGLVLTNEERTMLACQEVGGVILFSRNYQHQAQLKKLIQEVREVRSDILIAVDQEGGRVQRFRDEFESLPSLQKIANLVNDKPSELESICSSLSWLMATEILSIGIDISFAPVLDLDFDQCSVISDRSFSENPDEVIAMASAYLKGMADAGMAATVKHFPGHGGVNADSHLELPIDSRVLEDLRKTDIRPFAELVDQYAAVMPGHLLFPNIDSHSVGFSSFWLKEVLRETLNFQGVIFSDDLSMHGAAAFGSYSERAKLALTAGCDMLLVCNNPDGAQEVLRLLRQQPELINTASSNRIKKMKARRRWDKDKIVRSPVYSQAKNYLKNIEEKNYA